MQTVLTTPTFERQARAAGLGEEEMTEIVSQIAAQPISGELIVGTGGARRLRFARQNSGKSGGIGRSTIGGEDVPVFLLALVDKGDRANLSKAERNELAVLLPQLAEAYRASVARRVSEMRRR